MAFPTNAQELDTVLGTMQTKGASKDEMQLVANEYKKRSAVAANTPPNIEQVGNKLNQLIPGVGDTVKEVAPKVAQEQQIKAKLQEGISPVTTGLQKTFAPTDEQLAEEKSGAEAEMLKSGMNPEDVQAMSKIRGIGEPGIIQKTGRAVVEGLGEAGTGLKEMAMGEGREGYKKLIGGALRTVSAPIGAALSSVPGGETVGQALTPSTYTNFAIDQVGKLMGASPEDIEYWKRETETAADVAGLIAAPKVASKVKEYSGAIKNKLGELKTKVAPDITTKRATELQGVIDKNSPLRKYIEKQEKKGLNPKEEVVNSDVLSGAVDKEGVIRTKQEGGAVSQYTDAIKPAEDVVTKVIEAEGKTLPLKEVQSNLVDSIMNSGLEGEALTKALNAIKSEVEGYKLRAGPDGTIPISLIQKAKINKYSGINYLNEGGKIDKTIAKSLKEMVEKNTSADVKALNAELSKHYSAIGLLEKLDGTRVKGGRLGKYFAKGIGAMAGSGFGPLGAIAGAEIAGALEGRGMSKTFGKPTGKNVELSPLMKSTIEGNQSSKNARLLNTTQSTITTATKNPIDTAIAPTKGKVNKPFKQSEMTQTSLVDKYLQDNGKIINTDEARKLFPEYKGHNAAAVQEKASAVSNAAFDKALKTNQGKDGILYAGGSGVGKSSTINQILPALKDKAAAILDGNLSNYEKALARIETIKAAGKDPKVVYIYRDLVEAFKEGVVKRMINAKDGVRRVVPIDVHIQNHVGSLDTIKKIISNKDLSSVLLDNSLGKGKVAFLSIDKLNNIKYPNNPRAILTSYINKLFDDGKISKAEHQAFLSK